MTGMQCRIMDIINAGDAFCLENGIQLVEIGDDFSEARMPITPRVFNAGGTVQGGAIFALADLAFAGASNSGNVRTVAQGGSISFLRPGTGKFLRARARSLHRGKKTVVCDIDVYNDEEKLVAHATITGFSLETPLIS